MIKRGALFCVSLAFSLMLLVSLAMTGSHVFASEQPAISSSSSQSIVNSTSVNNQSKQNQNSTTDVHTAVSVVSSSHQPQDVSDRITNLTVVERDSKKRNQSIMMTLMSRSAELLAMRAVRFKAATRFMSTGPTVIRPTSTVTLAVRIFTSMEQWLATTPSIKPAQP